MKILIRNGRIINPATNLDSNSDLLIKDGVVQKIGNINEEVDEIIDASDCWVTPGLIDVHVHLRDPGFEYKEDINTGTRSAAAGGFTTVCCMPNTKPVTDNVEVINYIKEKALKEGIVNVLPIAAITIGQKGEELVDIKAVAQAGACGISEDGKSVLSSLFTKKAMYLAKENNIPVIAHCEDPELVAGGCMNEGPMAEKLGLRGISNDSESIMVARDIILAETTGAKLHICHVSTKESVDVLRDAHRRGVKVTSETCPHYYTLDDSVLEGYNVNAKMNPPIRSKKDVEAMKEALKDGTIEIIATDHAPHSEDEKNKDFPKALNGIVGLETAVPITITSLVDTNWLTPIQMIEKLTINPAKMLGIDKGDISEGKIADITIINPNTRFKIDTNKFESKGKSSPFHGYEVKGKVEYTIVNGRVAYEKGKIIGGAK